MGKRRVNGAVPGNDGVSRGKDGNRAACPRSVCKVGRRNSLFRTAAMNPISSFCASSSSPYLFVKQMVSNWEYGRIFFLVENYKSAVA